MWAVSYLLPTEKWLPIYWRNYDWEVIGLGSPPNGDYSGLPWWKNPDKSTWPYQPVPWEPKVFGAFSARKVTMWCKDPNEYSDLVNYPQFGTIKVKTPSDYSGVWPGKQASFMNIKVHMTPKPWLDISPHPSEWAAEKLKAALQEMSRKRPIKLVTPEGSITIKSMRSANWYRKRDDPRRDAVEMLQGAKEKEKHVEALAAEIAANGSRPKQSRDLFI